MNSTIKSQAKLAQLFVVVLMLFAFAQNVIGQSPEDPNDESVTISADSNMKMADVQELIKDVQQLFNGKLNLRVEETEKPKILIRSVDQELFLKIEAWFEENRPAIELSREYPKLRREAFTAKKLEKHCKSNGAFVFVRADWCLTCQHIETKTLADQAWLQIVVDNQIPLLTCDITDDDSLSDEAKAFQKKHNILQVPTLVYCPAEGDEVVFQAEDLAGDFLNEIKRLVQD